MSRKCIFLTCAQYPSFISSPIHGQGHSGQDTNDSDEPILSTNIEDYFHLFLIYEENDNLNSKNFITNKVKLHQEAPQNKRQVNQNKFSYEQLDEGKPHLKTPTNNLFFKIPP